MYVYIKKGGASRGTQRERDVCTPNAESDAVTYKPAVLLLPAVLLRLRRARCCGRGSWSVDRAAHNAARAETRDAQKVLRKLIILSYC